MRSREGQLTRRRVRVWTPNHLTVRGWAPRLSTHDVPAARQGTIWSACSGLARSAASKYPTRTAGLGLSGKRSLHGTYESVVSLYIFTCAGRNQSPSALQLWLHAPMLQ